MTDWNLHNDTDPASTLRAVKNAIREPFAFPGGYRKNIMTTDGAALCTTCARCTFPSIARSTIAGDRDGFGVIGVFIHWEGADDYCAHCNKALPSEYGDPDANEVTS